jgi:hypothetical protein
VAVAVYQSEKMRFHTDLRVTFEALGNCQTNYRWLLTGFEVNPLADGLPPELLPVEDGRGVRWIDQWMSGERLDEVLREYDFQLIWGVLSGFDRTHSESSLPAELPEAEGYTGSVRLSDAMIEIVAFDSTFTAVAARDPQLEKSFGAFFPEAQFDHR